MRSNNRVAALAALAIATPLAHGQPHDTPAPDPLCAGIAQVVRAAGEELPFISLVPAGQSLGSLPKFDQAPPGLAGFNNCQLYRAGNAKEGVKGGGPHNYVRCNLFQQFVSQEMFEKAATAKAQAMAAHEGLAIRARNCLAASGWTVSGGERKRDYEDYETALTFTRTGNVNDIVVLLREDNSSPSARSPSTQWTVDLFVRNPNPTHPKSQ